MKECATSSGCGDHSAASVDRQAVYDLGTCPNGPDEYGNWPCDPKVLFGGGYAECQVCGRVAAWGRETTKAWAKG